jgi:outer membrane protein assembly factor BamB
MSRPVPSLALCTLLVLLSAAPALSASDPVEELWDAARTGDATRVRQLLEAGVDPDTEFREGGTALIFAAQRGHAEVVRLLLDHGADPRAKDRVNNANALHFGIEHPEVVRMLAKGGADVNERDLSVGQTPLWWAVSRNKLESAMALLASHRVAPEAVREALELAERAGRQAFLEPLRQALAATPVVPSWPQFRGRRASGVAEGEKPPLEWNVESGTGVKWKTPIPGLGHSSPVVWGDRVFVTTAVSSNPGTDLRPASPMDSAADMSPHSWRVYALDRLTGKILWERVAWEGVPKTKRSPKNSFASPTPATDGKHLVVLFGSHGLYCYDLDGNLLWKRDLGVLDTGFFFDPAYQWGDASSPVLYKDLVIVQADLQKGSSIAAFDLKDGSPRWKTERDELPSWGTPTIVEGPQRTEVVTNGIKKIRSYDPATGQELWSLPTHNSFISAATPVYALDLIVVGNGYRPLRPIYAIRPGAKGEIPLGDAASSQDVAWSKKSGGPYYTTPIVYGEHLYVLSENGVLTNYYVKTGEEIYRQRVGDKGATFSASPVAANGHLYLTGEDGNVYVVKAGLEHKLVAVNPVGELCMATPALAGGMIYIRTRHHLLGIGR